MTKIEEGGKIMEEMMERPGMGWLPDLPDFRDYTVEQDEVSEKLKKLGQRKGGGTGHLLFGSPSVSFGPAKAGLRQMHRLSPPDKRVSNFIFVFEATYGFASAATRRFARPTSWAFVREPCVWGYPSHLPPTTWAHCRTPMVGL